jgi:hypothetical protein
MSGWASNGTPNAAPFRILELGVTLRSSPVLYEAGRAYKQKWPRPIVNINSFSKCGFDVDEVEIPDVLKRIGPCRHYEHVDPALGLKGIASLLRHRKSPAAGAVL